MKLSMRRYCKGLEKGSKIRLYTHDELLKSMDAGIEEYKKFKEKEQYIKEPK